MSGLIAGLGCGLGLEFLIRLGSGTLASDISARVDCRGVQVPDGRGLDSLEGVASLFWFVGLGEEVRWRQMK